MEPTATILSRLAGIEDALALLRHPLPAPLLRVSDVARILRCSRQTVRWLIESGELPASVLPLRHTIVHRIQQSDLVALVEGKIPKQSPMPAQPKAIRVPSGPF